MAHVPSDRKAHQFGPASDGLPLTVTLSGAHSPTSVCSGAAFSFKAGAPRPRAVASKRGVTAYSFFLTRLRVSRMTFDPAGDSNAVGRSASPSTRETVRV